MSHKSRMVDQTLVRSIGRLCSTDWIMQVSYGLTMSRMVSYTSYGRSDAGLIQYLNNVLYASYGRWYAGLVQYVRSVQYQYLVPRDRSIQFVLTICDT